jgi:glycerol-3-phosphate dehydrogenase
LRPLVAPEDEKDESDISRDDQIFESPSGLLSLGGGKLTTHRHVAERIVDLVASRLGRTVPHCRTHNTPLPGAAGVTAGAALDQPAQTREEHLRWRYGALAAEVSALVHGEDRLGRRVVDDCGDLLAEAAYAVDREMGIALVDVMTRRLHTHLRSRHVDETLARSVAEVMAPRLGWSPTRVDEEVRTYLAALARSRVRATAE